MSLMDTMVMKKTCSVCGESKELNEFYTHKTGVRAGSPYSECINCNKEKSKRYRRSKRLDKDMQGWMSKRLPIDSANGINSLQLISDGEGLVIVLRNGKPEGSFLVGEALPVELVTYLETHLAFLSEG